MFENVKYIQELEKGKAKIYKKNRICLIPDCTNNAILNSHVLQQKRILEKIIDNSNKFYVLARTSLFDKKHKGFMITQKKGIKESYIFPGFCKDCDRDFFKEIETEKIKFNRRRIKSLFAYRTLCLELRKKEIYLEHLKFIKTTRNNFFPNHIDYFDLRPAELSIYNLQFFKKELESELFHNKNVFTHFYLKLEQRKMCFSTPLTIYDKNNPLTFEYDEYGYTRNEPLAMCILNYFPYEDNSYLLASIHNKYKCNWTLDLINRIKKNPQIADKEISDIITYRTDFWAISPSIYEAWSNDKILTFHKESEREVNNFSYKIESDFSIWKDR